MNAIELLSAKAPLKREVLDAACYPIAEKRAFLVSCEGCNRVIRRPIEEEPAAHFCLPCWKEVTTQ